MVNQKKESETLATLSFGTGAVAAAVSAVAGVIASAAAETVGAAVITSGLAAVGGFIGGGMVAGLAVVAAAPIMGGTAALGVYKLYKHLASSSK